MLEEYNLIKPFIINSIHNERFIYKELGSKEVVGVLVSASSVIRKNFTIAKVKNIISRKKVDLKVVDDNEFANFFSIIKK